LGHQIPADADQPTLREELVTTLNTLRERLETPPGDQATSIRREEGEFVFTFLKEQRITRTLEIGFAHGVSAAYILAATGSPHYAIDPYADSYGELGLKNLKALEVDTLCHLERDLAHNALPRLLNEGRRFEFAFVDGDHKFDTTFVEFYYLDLIIEQNGYVMFHDGWMPSIQHIGAWIRANKKNYRFVDTRLANLILVQKVGPDTRDWRDFTEFRVPQSRVARMTSMLRRRF
jgi:predicted O-methyltransferase YrrM